MTMTDETDELIERLKAKQGDGPGTRRHYELTEIIAALRQLQAENKSLKEGWHAMTLAAKEVQRRHLGTHEGDVYHAMQALHTRHGYNSISRAAIDAALQQEKSDG